MEDLKLKIKNNLFNKSNKFCVAKCRYLEKNNNELYNNIMSYFLGETLYEKCYCILNDIKIIPICPITGNKVSFRNFHWGYYKFDMNTLTHKETSSFVGKFAPKNGKSISKTKKQKNRNIKQNFWKDYKNLNFSIYNKNKLLKKINLITKNYKKNKQFISINMYSSEPYRTTILNIYYHTKDILPITKYKTDFSNRIFILENNLHQLPKDSYGNTLYYQNYESGYCQYSIKDIVPYKKFENNYIKIKKILKYRGYELLTKKEEYRGLKYPLKYKKIKTGEIIEKKLHNGIWIKGKLDTSYKEENELFEWISNIIQNKVIKHYRDELEVDIYIPDYNLGIEIDGIYWHSVERGKNRNYHIDKTNFFKQKNIELLHFYDIEWNRSSNIIKSIILKKLNLLSPINPNFEICVLSKNEKKHFLNNNHIKGNCNTTIDIGIKQFNNVISIISLKRKNNDYYIIRYCDKINFKVNAFNVFIDYIKNNLQFNNLYYESDIRFQDYKEILDFGIIEQKIIRPRFYYGKSSKLYNPLKFQKSILYKKLKIYDETLTEYENLQLNGYFKTYDCGYNLYKLI